MSESHYYVPKVDEETRVKRFFKNMAELSKINVNNFLEKQFINSNTKAPLEIFIRMKGYDREFLEMKEMHLLISRNLVKIEQANIKKENYIKLQIENDL